MRKYLFLLLAMILALCGCENDSSPTPGDPGIIKAQINFNGIDSDVSTVPAESAVSPAALAEYILAASYNEPDRAYFIYRWIRNNIQPDLELAQQSHIDPATQSPESVFRTRKAVCTGYASTFRHMATLVNLNANEINGYGVMFSYTPGTAYNKYRHVWNSVEINGAWYLVELSWSASQSLDGSSDPSFFFLTNPSDFVYRHLPYDSKWQLLDIAVDENLFWSNLSYE